MKNSFFQEGKIKFNSKYHIIGDFDFVLRFSTIGKLLYSPKKLANYLKHENSESNKRQDLMLSELRNWEKEAATFPLICNDKNFKLFKQWINLFEMRLLLNKISVLKLKRFFDLMRLLKIKLLLKYILARLRLW